VGPAGARTLIPGHDAALTCDGELRDRCNATDPAGVRPGMSDPGDHVDQTARLVSHAAAWRAGNAEREDGARAIAGPSAERDLTTVERAEALRSARYASQAYPGPVGELIKSWIEDYVVDGKLLEPFCLARRLVRSMTTMEERSPLPPRTGYEHLPAVPVPGSGSRWRYQPTEDRG
jgi:hypothetical protein